LLFFLASGCDDEVCKEGATECVGTRAVRICAVGEDDNYWIPFRCDNGEVCQETDTERTVEAVAASDASVSDASMNDAAPTSANDTESSDDDEETGNAMCVGTCTEGDRECVAGQDRLARHCVDGARWETYLCGDGETCNNGECSRNYEDVYADLKKCTAGEKVCANEELQKICDADGTTWIGVYCRNQEVCENGDCVIDTGALCDPDEGMCDDDNNLIRCRENGVGYEKITCPIDTLCQYDGVLGDFACVGDLCAIGSTCAVGYEAEGQYVRDCVDGTSDHYTRCEVNERCVQMTPWVAQCVVHPTECTPGDVVCGDLTADPTADTVDESLFSVCVDDPENGTEGARWVVHQCLANNLLCDEDAAEAGIVPPCYKECTPGEQRCAPMDERPVGISQATQECSEDGTWGDAIACSTGEESYQVCARLVQLPGELPLVVCADPVCVLNARIVEDGGTCQSETEWLQCDEQTGQLVESDSAEVCESGICQSGLLPNGTTNYEHAEDGRLRGTCLPTDCEQGEQRCIRTLEGENTTRYLSCSENGKWETQPDTCEDNYLCFDYLNDEDLWTVICGADCVPGSRQCAGDDFEEIRICEEDGSWGDSNDCDFGLCDPIRNECVGQCRPDEKRCTGDYKVASDNYHTGTDSVETCSDEGFWSGDEEECDDDTTCRRSGAGVVLGCVECVGPEVVGGNEDSLVDSRCDDDTVQECNADNDDFEDITDCGDDFDCQPPSYGLMCTEYCYSASGNFVLCAEQFIQQQCDPCTVAGLGYLSECTVTALENAGAVLTNDCSGYSSSGDYTNSLNITATHSGADVTSSIGALTISMQTSYAMLIGDYGRIQYSWDNVLWYNALPDLTGSSGWTEVTRTIGAAPGSGTDILYIRFLFYSNITGVADGWKIDSVTVVDTDDAAFLSEDFEDNTDNWTFTGSWGTETIPGPSSTDAVVITESPGTVLESFDFGTPGAWAGVLYDDCCSDYQIINDAFPCPLVENTVITNNYIDCCQGYTTAVPGASQIAWCVEED